MFWKWRVDWPPYTKAQGKEQNNFWGSLSDTKWCACAIRMHFLAVVASIVAAPINDLLILNVRKINSKWLFFVAVHVCCQCLPPSLKTWAKTCLLEGLCFSCLNSCCPKGDGEEVGDGQDAIQEGTHLLNKEKNV